MARAQLEDTGIGVFEDTGPGSPDAAPFLEAGLASPPIGDPMDAAPRLPNAEPTPPLTADVGGCSCGASMRAASGVSTLALALTAFGAWRRRRR